VLCYAKDDALNRLRTLSDQLQAVELDRDQLSSRLDQSQKLILEVEGGKQTRFTQL